MYGSKNWFKELLSIVQKWGMYWAGFVGESKTEPNQWSINSWISLKSILPNFYLKVCSSGLTRYDCSAQSTFSTRRRVVRIHQPHPGPIDFFEVKISEPRRRRCKAVPPGPIHFEAKVSKPRRRWKADLFEASFSFMLIIRFSYSQLTVSCTNQCLVIKSYGSKKTFYLKANEHKALQINF
jgi:hypothetical protein